MNEIMLADSGREQVDEWNRKANEMFYHDIQQAYALNVEAEQLAVEIGYTEGRALSILQQAYCNQQLARNEIALTQLFDVLPLFASLQDNQGEINALKLIGDIHLQTGNYRNAIEYYFKSLRMAEEMGSLKLVGSMYVSIGSTYGNLDDYGAAEEYYLKALSIFRNEEHPQGEAVCLNNLGALCHHIGKYPEALVYLQEAVALAQSIQFTQTEMYALILIGEIYRSLGKSENSFDHLHRGLVLAQTSEDKVAEIECLRNLSEIVLAQERTDLALEHCTDAYTIACAIDAKRQMGDLCELFSRVWEAHGDFRQALIYHRRYHELDHEVVSAEAQRVSRNLQTQFEVERSQKEAEIHRLRNGELADALARLEAANNDLQLLNREKNEFLGIAAHDLRNPLIAIYNDAKSLNADFDIMGNEDILRIAQRGERSSAQMLSLIANLLDINRIEARKMTLTLEQMDWRKSIEQTLDLFAGKARSKNIKVQTDFAHVPAVQADRNALHQVIENLISNALKFSLPGGRILIRLLETPDSVTMDIQDEGPGLTPEDMQKVFGKFERLSAKPTAGEESTGLGLSIVRQLVEAMHGTVRCESDPGRGACFIVEFPIDRSE